MPALPTSLPRICVALGVSTAEQMLRLAKAEYKDGNTFLEFRLDYLSEPARGLELIQEFRKRYPDAQVLATCRHKDHSGKFTGSLQRQIEILNGAAKAGAVALDVEIESAEKTKDRRTILREQASLIVSYHCFRNTPALGGILRRLERIKAEAYKLATSATKPADTLRLTEFLKAHRGSPLIS